MNRIYPKVIASAFLLIMTNVISNYITLSLADGIYNCDNNEVVIVTITCIQAFGHQEDNYTGGVDLYQLGKLGEYTEDIFIQSMNVGDTQVVTLYIDEHSFLYTALD